MPEIEDDIAVLRRAIDLNGMPALRRLLDRVERMEASLDQISRFSREKFARDHATRALAAPPAEEPQN